MPRYKVVKEDYAGHVYWCICDEKDRYETGDFDSEQEAEQFVKLMYLTDEIQDELRRAIRLVMKRALKRLTDVEYELFLVDNPKSSMLDWLESFLGYFGDGDLRKLVEDLDVDL
jgi:hypothetical protein